MTEQELDTLVSDLNHTGELSMLYRMEIADAITALRAELAAARQPVTIKPLVWHNYDAWTYWAESTSGTYRVEERNGTWRATLNMPSIEHVIYEYDTDGETRGDFETAKAAAEADHNARILAALELSPTPVDASPAADPAAKVEAVAAAMWRAEIDLLPSHGATRTPDAFKEIPSIIREPWLILARAAIAAMEAKP